MRLLKKIIALICIIAISLSCLVVPAFAVDVGGMGDLVSGVADFGQWAIDSSLYGIKLVARIFDEDVCPERPGGVNTTHSFVVNTTTKDGVFADWYVCEYCGFNSGYKADSESLSAAYDDYVQTLPAPSYTSDGSILWSPKVAYWAIRGNSTAHLARCPHVPESEWNPADPDQLASFDCENLYFTDRSVQDSRGLYSPVFKLRIDDKYPIDGYYTRLPSLKIKGLYITTTTPSETITFESSYTSVDSTLFYAGDRVYADVEIPSSVGGRVKYISGYVYSYTYSIVPFNPSSVVNTYNINTRPTSITGGNYGIVGDNGQITKVEDNSTIINETNNTYYNPATGQTVPIAGWTYDYSDRSYKVTLESGDTVTVTYGDENITIQETTVTEGDTITNNYTIYYLIDGTGSGNPPSACEHTWTETNTTPATCTMPGSKLFTCSKCQQTKKESIPVLGHDWQVKQTVTTEYDETGQLVQEGYIIYECSRCHEQYKAASGTSPPVNPSDPDASGEGVFSGIFGLLLDFLGFFWKTFKDFTKSGVKAFLDALKDGTSDVFGLLNPFDWSA